MPVYGGLRSGKTSRHSFETGLVKLDFVACWLLACARPYCSYVLDKRSVLEMDEKLGLKALVNKEDAKIIYFERLRVLCIAFRS